MARGLNGARAAWKKEYSKGREYNLPGTPRPNAPTESGRILRMQEEKRSAISPRQRYKTEQSNTRFKKNYGNASPEQVKTAHKFGGRPTSNGNTLHHQQSQRLAQENRQRGQLNSRLSNYKSAKGEATKGSGSFTFNGRQRQLTDNGVATVKTNGALSPPVKSAGRSGQSSPSPSGKPENNASSSGRSNLTQGGSPTESFWEQVTSTASMGVNNLKTGVGANHGGSYLKAIGSPALKGAVWGGVAGGTLSAAQGGDFWSGAKQGAFMGATGAAGYRATKLATNAKSMGDIAPNAKNMWQHHAVSKPVRAIDTMQQNVNNTLLK